MNAKNLNQFRRNVVRFIKDNVNPDIQYKVKNGFNLAPDEIIRWQNTLYRQGWGAPAWPIQNGGTGWSLAEQYIFEEECALNYTPEQSPFGLKMIAPVLIEFGTKAQKEDFLPNILSGKDWWCQGFSEPNSGSDLASIRTVAKKDNFDNYIINGQKIWTTGAKHANWMFCLARTKKEEIKQQGLSLLLIKMDSPGITVRPIETYYGDNDINEVWFDNVSVPSGNLIGEEGNGWAYTKFLLSNERTNIARIGRSKANLIFLADILTGLNQTKSISEIDHNNIEQKKEWIEIELQALESLNWSLMLDAININPALNSILKLKGSRIQQDLAELLSRTLGIKSLFIDGSSDFDKIKHPQLTNKYFKSRAISLYGGSNEIQKNIIFGYLNRD